MHFLAFQASACLRGCTAHAHGGRAGIIVEYLQAPAKAFAWGVRGKNINFGSDVEGISSCGSLPTRPLLASK